DTILLSLAWIERHMRNFYLYERWEEMYAALRGGPVKRKQPDITLPIADGFRAELWAGDPLYPPPFLQPRILAPLGRTIFDLRDAAWSAQIRFNDAQPAVTLVFINGDREGKHQASVYPLDLDLISHRVTSKKLKGYMTLGMLQGM